MKRTAPVQLGAGQAPQEGRARSPRRERANWRVPHHQSFSVMFWFAAAPRGASVRAHFSPNRRTRSNQFPGRASWLGAGTCLDPNTPWRTKWHAPSSATLVLPGSRESDGPTDTMIGRFRVLPGHGALRAGPKVAVPDGRRGWALDRPRLKRVCRNRLGVRLAMGSRRFSHWHEAKRTKPLEKTLRSAHVDRQLIAGFFVAPGEHQGAQVP